MKKLVLALGILGVSSLGIPVTGLAAEANPTASMTSEASLTINPGILSLDSVSNFDFGTGDIADFAQQEKVITTLSNETSSVSDFRGPNTAGWQLTAKLSKITNATQKELTNAKVTLKGTETVGNAALTANAELIAGATDPTSIATANGTTGLAISTFDFSTTTLTVPQQNVYGGDYTGTITWTLTNSYQAN
ncbi:WxL domain-containing protein [Enterococcus gallinarum]|uniref:WxL domain-containing protein n=1 Tax=Enterococcus gallinarum TaxID=1353 RepID=UPI00288F70D6|nr:WxL domain-containing protein [Enterococcus gallinarum]MDT2684910.1 WxL domain-containing protein [Enterococcus gallinarum]